KHSQNYEKISQYLELSGEYLPSMTIFDQAWQMYLEKMN
ncbi:YozE family protein, partial [Liquorilactobacillus uvarum]